MQLNESRIKVLQAQDDVVNAMKDSAAKELQSVSSDKKGYKKLLKGLVVQVFSLHLPTFICNETRYFYLVNTSFAEPCALSY